MKQQPNILIVEDELVIAFDLKKQLEKLNYRVCDIVSSVPDARVTLQKHQPDIALLDIKLSDNIPGTVLGEELRMAGHIPFIYITSHYDRATVEEAKATRPSAYLIKPFSKEDIYVAIEMALTNFAHKDIDVIGPKTTETAIPNKLKKVVQHIHNNLDKKLTLPELAELTGWNMYHFARMFKKYLHDSPYQYLQKVRIEHAKKLMEENKLNVAQVALELGFENHSHFSQTFRKMVGMSPDTFRKKSTKT